MAKAILGMLLIGGIAAWGQSEKVDRAAAYYHYTVAQMYSELAAVPGARSSEYADKAIEELQLAIKADPQSAVLREELARGPGSRRFVAPFFRPSRTRPRQDAGADTK
jgi:hypothetical protein